MTMMFVMLSISLIILASGKSCCELNKDEIERLEGLDEDCVENYFLTTSLAAKCEECPRGRCRLDFSCMCPRNFLSSSSAQSQCLSSFKSSWPSSIGEEDTQRRSCADGFDAPPRSDVSCCELSKEELEKRVGTGGDCPEAGFSLSFLAAKCQKCAPGRCRVGLECKCPSEFLSSTSLQSRCRDSFEFSWPDSVGKEDISWRSCRADFVSPKASARSCCSMSEEELKGMRGKSNSCPGSSLQFAISACEKCSAGLCRVGFSCLCPSELLSDSRRQAECLDAIGAVWPESVGRTDSALSNCPPEDALGEDDVTTTANESDSGGESVQGSSTPSSTESSSPSSTETSSNASMSSTPTPPSSSGSPSIQSSSSSTGEEKEQSGGGGLSGLEIAGIIAGIIGTVVAIIGLGFQLRRRSSRARRVAASARFPEVIIEPEIQQEFA